MCAAGIRPSSLTRARDSFWWVSINSRLWFCWLLFHCFLLLLLLLLHSFSFSFRLLIADDADFDFGRFFYCSSVAWFMEEFFGWSICRCSTASFFFTEFFIFFFNFSIEVFFCYGRRWGPWRRKMCRDSIFRPSSSFAYQSGLGGNQKGHRRRRLRLDPNDE